MELSAFHDPNNSDFCSKNSPFASRISISDRVYLDRVDSIDHLRARMLANEPRLQKMREQDLLCTKENNERSIVSCDIELRPTNKVWRFGAALGARFSPAFLISRMAETIKAFQQRSDWYSCDAG